MFQVLRITRILLSASKSMVGCGIWFLWKDQWEGKGKCFTRKWHLFENGIYLETTGSRVKTRKISFWRSCWIIIDFNGPGVPLIRRCFNWIALCGESFPGESCLKSLRHCIFEFLFCWSDILEMVWWHWLL